MAAEWLSIDEISRRLKELDYKPNGRSTIYRLWKDYGEAGPLRMTEDGKLVGRLIEVQQALVNRRREQAGLSKTAAAGPKTSTPDPVPELFDLESLEGDLDDVLLEDPEYELKEARRLLRSLSLLVRHLDLRKLKDSKVTKTFMQVAEAASRTLARTVKARDDLLDIRRREGQLLPLDDVAGLMKRLGEHLSRLDDSVSDELLDVCMRTLDEQGIPPEFNSDLLRDRLAAKIHEHRDLKASAIEERRGELCAS